MEKERLFYKVVMQRQRDERPPLLRCFAATTNGVLQNAKYVQCSARSREPSLTPRQTFVWR